MNGKNLKRSLTDSQVRDYVKSGEVFPDFLAWLRKPHKSQAGFKNPNGNLSSSPLDLFLRSMLVLDIHEDSYFKVDTGKILASDTLTGEYNYVCPSPEWMDRYNFELSKSLRQGNISFITALHRAEKLRKVK